MGSNVAARRTSETKAPQFASGGSQSAARRTIWLVNYRFFPPCPKEPLKEAEISGRRKWSPLKWASFRAFCCSLAAVWRLFGARAPISRFLGARRKSARSSRVGRRIARSARIATFRVNLQQLRVASSKPPNVPLLRSGPKKAHRRRLTHNRSIDNLCARVS